jgi:hypothetical protein
MIRKAKSGFWQGTGRAGSGRLSSESRVLSETPYSFRTRCIAADATTLRFSSQQCPRIEKAPMGCPVSKPTGLLVHRPEDGRL